MGVGADISRDTHDPKKQYTKVIRPQGTVEVDADHNEQIDILNHFERSALTDVIGQSGYPAGSHGFEIAKTQSGGYTIGVGRYYVDGILVENNSENAVPVEGQQYLAVPANGQPYLPLSNDGQSDAIPTISGTHLLYLDVWERHVTPIDDPEIRESALGGAYTSTRDKIVWQVKSLPVKGGSSLKRHVVANGTMGETGLVALFPTVFSGPHTDLERDPKAGFPVVASIAIAPRGVSPVVTRQLFTITVECPAANKDPGKREMIEVDIVIGDLPNTIKAEELEPDKGIFEANFVLDPEGSIVVESPSVERERKVGIFVIDGRIEATYIYDVSVCEAEYPEWTNLIKHPSGLMMARTKPEEHTEDACMLPPGAGYRRLENQLYRIEVHNNGKIDNGATFKWSRENASIITQVKSIAGKTITVAGIGKDKVLGFSGQQWVELTDDRHELLGLPGAQAKVNVVSENELVVVEGAITESEFPQEFAPKIIRWDMNSLSSAELKIEIPSTNDGWIPIEDGVEVQFGPADSEYRSGDYWVVPARTLKGDIEWPKETGGSPEFKESNGIKHHYARLALVEVDNEKKVFSIVDCRKQFPSLTNLQIVPPSPIPPPPPQIQEQVTRVHGNIVMMKSESPSVEGLILLRTPTAALCAVASPNVESENLEFYFAIATSTVQDDNNPSKLTAVYLLWKPVRALGLPDAGSLDAIDDITSDEAAVVTQVDVCDGSRLIHSYKLGHRKDYSMELFEGENLLKIDPPEKINFGLSLCAHVKLSKKGNPIGFFGVGARFKSS